MASRKIFRGYTKAELEIGFYNATHEMADWRGRIDATVLASKADVTIAGIAFFTGCEATAEPVEFMGKPGLVRIRAVGYRAGPCGP